MHIGDYLGRRALYTPDRLAIIDAGKDPQWRLTYHAVNERANRFANWLRDAAGVGKGDRVAILARDGVEHLDCFFACGKLGAIHTALNWRLHWRELEGIVGRTRPALLIFSDDFRDGVAALQAAVKDAPHAIRQYLHIEGPGIDGSLHFESALHSGRIAPVSCETLAEEDIAALILTGGTTGLPKAAQVSHRMIAWNTLNTVIHDLAHNDVYLNVFPLFHTGGLFVYTLPQIILGGATILLRQFDPARVLQLIEHQQVTLFAGVPTMYQMLTQAENWAQANLSSLRFCTSGGAPLPLALIDKYTSEKSVRFKQGFGMTEFGPGVFALAPEDALRKAGSIGRPNFFVDARIVDEQGSALPPGEVGELLLRGPSCCSGYFDARDANSAVLGDDGWLHTGDLARCDQEGYYYIVDRKKDMFISGGENIYPAEIEAVLYQHPAVYMCAVVGTPDLKWGEAGVACVVLKQDATATEKEVIAFLSNCLARYKVPKRVVFLESMPISAAGKILKRELKRQLGEECPK
ncbi:MAG: acyl-CoA synthetase [Chromatiales bacterium]